MPFLPQGTSARSIVIPRIGAGGGANVYYRADVDIVVPDTEVMVIVGSKPRGSINFVVGDRSVKAACTIYQSNGYTPFDLTGWTSPTFVMATGNDEDTRKVNYAAAVIEDATGGQLRYDWAAADVDTGGEYMGRFRLTDPSGLQRHFPGSGYIRINISDQP